MTHSAGVPRRVMLRALAIASLAIALSPGAGRAVVNPFPGQRLFVTPDTPARKQAAQWVRTRPADAARMQRIADQAHAVWLGEWTGDVRREVERVMTQAAAARGIPVFVAYNIPYRDCGLHSRGGARGANEYRRWIVELARGIRNRPSMVVVEPDGLAAIDCLPARLRDERYVLIREAVDVLTKAGAHVYVDAGNANWQQPGEMASRLRNAGTDRARGFALNVSNFHATSVNVTYGDRLSGMLGDKRYVIDTSRNGRAARVEREWCNARDQALGFAPTLDTGLPLVDAFLWVKTPGQSDGTCNGGPRAGDWWPDYALGLARTAESLGSLTRR